MESWCFCAGKERVNCCRQTGIERELGACHKYEKKKIKGAIP